MPKRRRSSLPPSEVVSSSDETMSGGETDPSSSSPSTRAHHGTPEPADHHPRHNDRSSPRTRSPRRQPVRRLGPPRPRPPNSDRQMTMLDIDWEVRQLERFRRQQPESFGRRRAAAWSESVPARASGDYSRHSTLARARLLEELTSLEEHNRLSAIDRFRERQRSSRRQARAVELLAYDDARTMFAHLQHTDHHANATYN